MMDVKIFRSLITICPLQTWFINKQLNAIECNEQVTKDYWVHYCNKI